MKWDIDKKELVERILERRFIKIIDEMELQASKIPSARQELLDSLSIKTCVSRYGPNGWPCWYFVNDNVILDNYAVKENQLERATRKDRIIIDDPWSHAVTLTVELDQVRKKLLALSHEGLSVPKDVAEKFLVLGIP